MKSTRFRFRENTIVAPAPKLLSLNIFDRIKEYKCQIIPSLDKKLDTVKLEKVQEFLKQQADKHWFELDLYECLTSLYGQEKLFHLKVKSEEPQNTSWECYTYMDSYVVVATAPTRIEAYKVALVTILKEFYYFPFDDRMELPLGAVHPISGDTFNKGVLYPNYQNIVLNDIQKFCYKERAYDFFKKNAFDYDGTNNQKHVEGALLKMLDAERIETFFKDNEKMVKINQFIWIGSTSSNISLIALGKLLEINNLFHENGTPKSPLAMAKLIYEESLKSQSFEAVEVTLSNLVLPD